MCAKPFPARFPLEIASEAFVANNEAAWRPAPACKAIEWLAANGYAVLGTELWLLENDGTIQSAPLGSSGMREVHGNSINRERGEAWALFASRSAAETLAYLRSFNPADIVENGEVYFNVVWASESDFQKFTL